MRKVSRFYHNYRPVKGFEYRSLLVHGSSYPLTGTNRRELSFVHLFRFKAGCCRWLIEMAYTLPASALTGE